MKLSGGWRSASKCCLRSIKEILQLALTTRQSQRWWVNLLDSLIKIFTSIYFYWTFYLFFFALRSHFVFNPKLQNDLITDFSTTSSKENRNHEELKWILDEKISLSKCNLVICKKVIQWWESFEEMMNSFDGSINSRVCVQINQNVCWQKLCDTGKSWE